MVDARVLSRYALILAAGLIAALGLALIPASAAKAAPSLAESQRQVDALGRKLDQINEKYNTAKVQLAKVKAQQAAVDKQVGALEGNLDVAQDQVGKIAASAYRDAKIGPWTAVLRTGSPQDFLDQMTYLEQLSDAQSKTVDQASTAKSKLDGAKKQADEQVAKAAGLEKTLAGQKASLNKELVKWRKLRDQVGATANRSSGGKVSYTGNASGSAATAVQYALNQQGDPYVFGGDGPNGYDCSGLTMAAWAAAGVTYLTHSAHEQKNELASRGKLVSRSQVRAGDLVFFYPDIGHVGIAISNSQMVHAPTEGESVKVASIDSMGGFNSAGRP